MSILNLEGEVWKDIPDYEGFYQVSNMGRIKALYKKRMLRNNGFFEVKEHIMVLGSSTGGHLVFNLCKNGQHKKGVVHRLVAKLFCPNPNNYKEVNHIIPDKTNNKADNLEWTTRQANMRHAVENGLMRKPIMGDSPHAKLVLDMRTGIYYDCIKEAAIARGLKYDGNLRNKLIGVRENNTDIKYV